MHPASALVTKVGLPDNGFYHLGHSNRGFWFGKQEEEKFSFCHLTVSDHSFSKLETVKVGELKPLSVSVDYPFQDSRLFFLKVLLGSNEKEFDIIPLYASSRNILIPLPFPYNQSQESISLFKSLGTNKIGCWQSSNQTDAMFREIILDHIDESSVEQENSERVFDNGEELDRSSQTRAILRCPSNKKTIVSIGFSGKPSVLQFIDADRFREYGGAILNGNSFQTETPEFGADCTSNGELVGRLAVDREMKKFDPELGVRNIDISIWNLEDGKLLEKLNSQVKSSYPSDSYFVLKDSKRGVGVWGKFLFLLGTESGDKCKLDTYQWTTSEISVEDVVRVDERLYVLGVLENSDYLIFSCGFEK
jgi:hypothetical protein